jgi:hypothetical protein
VTRSQEGWARMIRLVSLLALVLSLVACSTGTDDTRPVPLAATATGIPIPPDTPTATASATATPPATITPSPTPWPTPTPPAGCRDQEITDLLTRFFAAHSRGDAAAVRGFFPQQGSPPGSPDGISTHFQWFSVTDFDPQQGRRHFVAYQLEDLWPYLAARQAQREWLHLTRLKVNSMTYDGVAHIEYALAREADDLPPHAISGKGAINCKDQTIIVWSMGSDPAPVTVTRPPATPAGTPTSEGR